MGRRSRSRAWQPQRTVFQQAAAAGVAASAVGPNAFAGSGLTQAVYRGADYPARSAPATWPRWCWPRSAPRPGRSSTATSPSSTSPGTCAASTPPAWRAQLGLIDRMVEQLVDGLPDDAALLVTADHGMLDVPADTRLDLEDEPELMDGVRLLAGEPRARYVHAEDGAPTTCWTAGGPSSGSRAWVAGRDEAVASGIFGPVDEGLAAAIGDVVALARGTLGVHAPRSASRAPARSRPTTARSPRPSWRSRCSLARGPRARLSASAGAPSARTCQVRECAGCVARQVRCTASSDGRLSTVATTSPSGPAMRHRPPLDLGAGRGEPRWTSVTGRSSTPSRPSSRGRAAGRPAPPADAGPAAQPRQRHLAALVRGHQLRAVAGHLPVVEAVRQHQHVGGEPVPAQVAALPHVGRAGGRQRAGQRAPAQRAAGVVPAVRADQVGRAGAPVRRPSRPRAR